jgi:hypothetical protein
MFKFKLPIGDWSDDGHGKHEDYLIESNKPLEVIRELYFQACEKLGFTLDGHHALTPCGDYQDYYFKPETMEALLKFGLNISEEQKEGWVEDGIETEEFCDLVLDFIKTQDPELQLTRIPNENFPMFQFYGFDHKQRHIGYFGYGLF